MLPVKCELLIRDPEFIIEGNRTTLLGDKVEFDGNTLFPVLFYRRKYRKIDRTAVHRGASIMREYSFGYTCSASGSTGD